MYELFVTGSSLPDAYHKALSELKFEARVSFEELSKVRHQTVLAKLDHIKDHIQDLHEEDPSRKIIFFAHHRDVLEAVSRHFSGSPVVMGGITPEAKQAAGCAVKRHCCEGPYKGSSISARQTV